MKSSKLLVALLGLVALMGPVRTLEIVPLHYHEAVGIPLAESTRQAEEQEGSTTRVSGGSEATLGEFPFYGGLVGKLKTGQTSLCGSSLLIQTRLLSAAHCWWDGRHQVTKFTVVLGSLRYYSGGTRIETSDVTVHKDYNPRKVINDVLIVRIEEIIYTDTISNVALPTNMLDQDFVGTWAIVIGLGKTSGRDTDVDNRRLQKGRVQVITNEKCQKSYGKYVTAGNMCTSREEGVGSCSGDSGGPLVISEDDGFILIGVTSYGPRRTCVGKTPNAQSRVTYFYTWIQDHL